MTYNIRALGEVKLADVYRLQMDIYHFTVMNRDCNLWWPWTLELTDRAREVSDRLFPKILQLFLFATDGSSP